MLYSVPSHCCWYPEVVEEASIKARAIPSAPGSGIISLPLLSLCQSPPAYDAEVVQQVQMHKLFLSNPRLVFIQLAAFLLWEL